jgi:phospholipase/carboxylesterase
MTSTTGLDGPRQAPASGGPAQQLIVLLHGLGADGDDLIGLAPYLAQALPDAAFAAPNAPFPCDRAPMGFQWFSLDVRDGHTALRRPEPVAGIVGFSGLLVAPDRLAGEIASRPPVLLVHGEADPVVPFAALAASEKGLADLEVPVRSLPRPGLGHSIDEAGLRAAVSFLTERFRG